MPLPNPSAIFRPLDLGGRLPPLHLQSTIIGVEDGRKLRLANEAAIPPHPKLTFDKVSADCREPLLRPGKYMCPLCTHAAKGTRRRKCKDEEVTHKRMLNL